ncbi:MAG: hypothetical protein R3F15_18395 [Lysobacterales bacterium]
MTHNPESPENPGRFKELRDTSRTLAVLAMIVLPVIAGAVLWSLNLLVARRFFYRHSGEQALSLDGVEHLETALFGLLGLWLVVSALISLVRSLAWWLLTLDGTEMMDMQMLWAHSFGPELAATIATLLLGVALLLRQHGLVRLLRHLRGRE